MPCPELDKHSYWEKSYGKGHFHFNGQEGYTAGMTSFSSFDGGEAARKWESLKELEPTFRPSSLGTFPGTVTRCRVRTAVVLGVVGVCVCVSAGKLCAYVYAYLSIYR